MCCSLHFLYKDSKKTTSMYAASRRTRSVVHPLLPFLERSLQGIVDQRVELVRIDSEELEVDPEDTGAQPEDPPCKARRKRGKRVPTATRRLRKRERMLAVEEESVPAGGSLHNETDPDPPVANADVVQVADAEALSDDLAPSEEVSLPAEVLWTWYPEPKICPECWTAIPS